MQSSAYTVKMENMLQLAEYQKSLWKHPNLRYLFFELTDRCNLNCLHCGSSCTAHNSDYLPFEVIDRVLTEVAELYSPRNIMICLTGGEAMLHPAIYEVISRASELGFSVGMTTNGTLIGPSEARHLKVSGLDTVAVSVDGLRETHEAFRRVKGSFDKAMAGIHALQHAGIEPQIITVVHKQNFEQLDEMFQYFSAQNIYSWRLVNMDPIGRAKESNNLLLDGSELKALYEFIREKRFDLNNQMEVTSGCSHFQTLEFERMTRDFYFQCQAGTQVASIMANGDIGTCLDIERRRDLIQGNIYQDDFIDVWENRFALFRQNRAETSESCRECKYKDICMGDSAHTWDYDRKQPTYCVTKMWEESAS